MRCEANMLIEANKISFIRHLQTFYLTFFYYTYVTYSKIYLSQILNYLSVFIYEKNVNSGYVKKSKGGNSVFGMRDLFGR